VIVCKICFRRFATFSFAFSGCRLCACRILTRFLAAFDCKSHEMVLKIVFPTRVFWLFSPTRNPGFFNYQTRVFWKTWNYCCIEILSIRITLKLQNDACNGQTSTFKFSIIIMRHEVRVLHRWPSYVRCWSVYIFVQLTHLDGSWRHFAHNRCLR